MTTPIITRVALCVILFLCCTYIVNLSQKKFDQVINDLLSALRSTLDLGSTIFDLAYGKE